MKSLDPARTDAAAEPAASDWEMMRARMAVAPSPRRSRGRGIRALSWALPVAASIVIGVTLTVNSVTAEPALALTPPALEIVPVPTSDDLAGEAVASLRAQQVVAPVRGGKVVRWAKRSYGNDLDPVVVPAWHEWVWNGDGTGELRVTAGAPYSVSADGEIIAPVGDAPAEGQRLEAPIMGPTPQGYFSTPPPATAAELDAYLAEALGPRADPLGIWGRASLLLDEWTLSPGHHAAIIEMLASTGQLRPLGTVTDRLGREGVALGLTSSQRPEFEVRIFLDAGDRRIIAADTVYLGGVDQLALVPGSVVEYSAWVSKR